MKKMIQPNKLKDRMKKGRGSFYAALLVQVLTSLSLILRTSKKMPKLFGAINGFQNFFKKTVQKSGKGVFKPNFKWKRNELL